MPFVVTLELVVIVWGKSVCGPKKFEVSFGPCAVLMVWKSLIGSCNWTKGKERTRIRNVNPSGRGQITTNIHILFLPQLP
ncbi:hypothetical protein ACFX2F_028995 [Malus domestica]